MAVELDKHKITVISLWPGAVKTELIEKNVLSKSKDTMGPNELAMHNIFEDGESTEYSGMVLKHFAADSSRVQASETARSQAVLKVIAPGPEELDIVPERGLIAGFLHLAFGHPEVIERLHMWRSRCEVHRFCLDRCAPCTRLPAVHNAPVRRSPTPARPPVVAARIRSRRPTGNPWPR